MTPEDLRTWAERHFAALVTMRRSMQRLNPMAVLRQAGARDVLVGLVVPKVAVAYTLDLVAREHQAVALALMMDTWVGPPVSEPRLPPGFTRVRDMPGAQDALVVAAMLATGATGMWMARYQGEGAALTHEPPTWSFDGVSSRLLPGAWVQPS